MLDHGNGQMSAVGFFNPLMGQAPMGDFFGGGVGGGSSRASAFDLVGNKVVRCMMFFGRSLVTCPDTVINLQGFTGLIVAKIDHSTADSISLSVEKKAMGTSALSGRTTLDLGNTPYITYRALYVVTSGKLAADLRLAPQVPAFLP